MLDNLLEIFSSPYIINTSLISKMEVADQMEDGIVLRTPYQVEMGKILGLGLAELQMVFLGLDLVMVGECHAALAKLQRSDGF